MSWLDTLVGGAAARLRVLVNGSELPGRSKLNFVSGADVTDNEGEDRYDIITSVVDATTSVKGKVKLAGDLLGTSALPTVIAATSGVQGKQVIATGIGGASSATFVHSRRGELSTADPQFGITGDGTTDDTVGLQAWIDAIISTGKSGLIAVGTYKTTKPLIVNQAVRFEGIDCEACQFHPYFSGPVFRIGGAKAVSANRVASLFTGGTYAWQIDGSEPIYPGFNAVVVDGLANATLKFRYKHGTSVTGSDTRLVAGYSGYDFVAINNPLQVCVRGSGFSGNDDCLTLIITTTTSGEVTLQDTAAMTPGSTYDIEVGLDSVTGKAYLFRDGVKRVEAACLGTIVQPSMAAFRFGPSGLTYPFGGGTFQSAVTGAVIDGVQLLNTACHTANYTPASTKPVETVTGGVLLTMNFEDWLGTDLVRGLEYANLRDSWCPVLQGASAFGQVFGTRIGKFSVHPHGNVTMIYNVSCPESHFYDIRAVGGCVGAVFTHVDDYLSTYDRITADSLATLNSTAIVSNGAANGNTYNDCTLAYFANAFIFGSGVVYINRPYLNGLRDRAIFARNTLVSLESPQITTEGVGTYADNVVTIINSSAHIRCGVIQPSFSAAGPYAVFGIGSTIIVDGTQLSGDNASAGLVGGITDAGGTRSKIILRNCRREADADTAWTDTPEQVVLQGVDIQELASDENGYASWIWTKASVGTGMAKQLPVAYEQTALSAETAFTWPLRDNTVTTIHAHVQARSGTNWARWKVSVTYNRDSAGAPSIGAAMTSDADGSNGPGAVPTSWACIFDLSSNTLRLRTTAAANALLLGRIEIQEARA